MRQHSAVRQGDGLDRAVRAKLQTVKANNPVMRADSAQRTAVVTDDPLILGAGQAQNRVMPRALGYLGIVFEDLADVLERTIRIIRDAIRREVALVGPVAFAPHQIIQASALYHERPLDVVRRRCDLPKIPVNGAHRGSERGHNTMGMTTKVQVGPAVVVHKAVCVDGLRTVRVVANERPAYRIAKRSGR